MRASDAGAGRRRVAAVAAQQRAEEREAAGDPTAVNRGADGRRGENVGLNRGRYAAFITGHGALPVPSQSAPLTELPGARSVASRPQS